MFRRKDLLKKVKWQDEGAIVRARAPYGSDAPGAADLVGESYDAGWYDAPDAVVSDVAYYGGAEGYAPDAAGDGWYGDAYATDTLDTLVGDAGEAYAAAQQQGVYDAPRAVSEYAVSEAEAVSYEDDGAVYHPSRNDGSVHHAMTRDTRERVEQTERYFAPSVSRRDVVERRDMSRPSVPAAVAETVSDRFEPAVAEAPVEWQKPEPVAKVIVDAKAALAEQFARHSEHMLLRKLVKPASRPVPEAQVAASAAEMKAEANAASEQSMSVAVASPVVPEVQSSAAQSVDLSVVEARKETPAEVKRESMLPATVEKKSVVGNLLGAKAPVPAPHATVAAKEQSTVAQAAATAYGVKAPAENGTSSAAISPAASRFIPAAKADTTQVLAKEEAPMSRTAHLQDRSAASNRRTLTVGQETFLKGEITNCDHVIIEGSIDASMTEVCTLEIAPNGLYRGTAVVDHAEISGEFDGELEVRGRLRIHADGKVTGKVSFRELEVARGGQLLGHVTLLEGTAAVAAPVTDEVEEIVEYRKLAQA